MIRQVLPSISVPLPSNDAVADWMSRAEELTDSIDSDALFTELWFELYNETKDNPTRLLLLEYLAVEGAIDETEESLE